MIQDKTKQGVGVQFALQIIEEGKRPMSPAQIKAKYKLDFPFTVKRVVVNERPRDHCMKCRGPSLKTGLVGEVLTFLSLSPKGDYLLGSCKCGILHSIFPNSERFVYFDGGVS